MSVVLVNKFFHSNVKDIMTGYRVFSRLFVKHFSVLSKGFEIETEVTIHALDKNFLLQEVPVQYREGSVLKLNTYFDGFKVLMTIAHLFRDYKPFVFFTLMSILLFAVVLTMDIPVFMDYLAIGLVPKFPTLIVSGVIAIFALLFFFCGLIFEVITKKHKQMFEIMMNK